MMVESEKFPPLDQFSYLNFLLKFGHFLLKFYIHSFADTVTLKKRRD